MSKIWNVAIIGGGVGRLHIEEGYLPHRDKFRLAALCDLDEERLRELGDKFDIPRRTTSFDEVLGMDDIDIVDICTPSGLHAEQTIAALKAGKHVVCEKPVAGSLADIDRVIQAEQASKGRVMPIFQYRYGDGLQRAKRIIDSGVAGKPYVATVETFWKRLPAYYAVPWRGKWATELGGALVTHAIHNHDILTYLLGDVETVYAQTRTRINQIEVEDCAVASLVMKSGALVSCAATLGSQEEYSRLRFAFENVTFESGLEPYQPGTGPWRIIPASNEIQQRIDAALEDWTPVKPRFEGQMKPFHDALTSGGPMPVTLADARRSAELITAFYHSAESNAPVALPIGEDHPKYRSWWPQSAINKE